MHAGHLSGLHAKFIDYGPLKWPSACNEFNIATLRDNEEPIHGYILTWC